MNKEKLKRTCQSEEDLCSKHDWKAIQIFGDSGKSWRDICKEYHLNFAKLAKAKKLGLFKSRTKEEVSKCKQPTRKHSVESKIKMSIARKKYLSTNNRPAWKTHDKFKSIPCEILKDRMRKEGFCFVEEFQPLIHLKRFFSIDIAFPDKKISIEINGGQHYDTDGNLKPYYQKRNDLITSDGWQLFEFKYHFALTTEGQDSIMNTIKSHFPKINCVTT